MIIERILLNTFFVVLPLILIPIIFNTRYITYTKYHAKYFIMAAIIVSYACMTFSIPINSLFNFDFRFIPFLFISLYFGPKASILLFILLMGYRYYLGGSGVLLAAMVSIFYVGISLLYSKKFRAFTMKKRIITFTLTIVATWIFIFSYMHYFNDAQYSMWQGLLLLSQTVAAFIVVYLKEYIQSVLGLQSQLIKTEKMEVVGQLAAAISHEVRNPLTTVRGFLQLLSQATENEKQQEYIHISLEELDRATVIINNYLTFAKPSLMKMEIIDFKEEILRLIEVIRPLANQNSIVIVSNVSGKLFIKFDPQLFRQCFINIFKNGIEAMPDGGTLIITAYEENERIIVKITDNGVGMTDETISRLGEPYFTTKGSKGTGLGMLVVNRIIADSNGTIDIKSDLGMGTEVTISLPNLKDTSK